MSEPDPTMFYREDIWALEGDRRSVQHSLFFSDHVGPHYPTTAERDGQRGAVRGPVFNQFPSRLCIAHCQVAQGLIDGVTCTLIDREKWKTSARPTEVTRSWGAQVSSRFSDQYYPNELGGGRKTIFEERAENGKIPCQTAPEMFVAEVERQRLRDENSSGTQLLVSGIQSPLFSADD